METLDNFLNHMVDMFCAKPFIVSVIFSDEIFKNKQKLSSKITQLIKQNNECIRLFVEHGQINKEIRKDIDANELAIIIIGSFRMVIKNWQLSKQVYSLKLRGQGLFVSLFKIISIN